MFNPTRKVVAISLFGILSACATYSIELASSKYNAFLNDNYLNKSSDRFFQQFGSPVSSYSLENGDVVYKWQKDYQSSETYTTYEKIKSTSDYYEDDDAYYDDDYEKRKETSISIPVTKTKEIYGNCEINVTVSKTNIIKNFSILEDTFSGDSRPSYCYTYLTSQLSKESKYKIKCEKMKCE